MAEPVPHVHLLLVGVGAVGMCQVVDRAGRRDR
jgi:hypothetical protein